LLTVKENRFVKEMEEDTKRFGLEKDSDENNQNTRKLTNKEIISLLLILASVTLWYMGYNAVTTKYSVYASNILQKDYNTTLIIAQAAAIVAYLPVGIIASKIGRKKCILAGVLMLGAAFGAACFITADSPALFMNAMFALAGIGWATINVNSFPMVVELAKGGNVGKYTGYYYTASMAAQVLTPYLSGQLMDSIGMRTLFPYATLFVAASFVTMLFVRHGDTIVEAKHSVLENFDIED
jgi:MFS family permease